MIKIILIILFLLIINNLYLHKLKGGHFIDRKIKDHTILPIINTGLIGLHDLMHWIFSYGSVKQDEATNNVLKKEITSRLNANNFFNKVLNNSYTTNKTRLAIKNKISKNKQIIKDIISDII